MALEKGRLGGIAVGAGQIEPLRGIDELLGFLDDVGQVGKHGFDQRRMTGRGGRGCGRAKGGEGGDRTRRVRRRRNERKKDKEREEGSEAIQKRRPDRKEKTDVEY